MYIQFRTMKLFIPILTLVGSIVSVPLQNVATSHHARNNSKTNSSRPTIITITIDPRTEGLKPQSDGQTVVPVQSEVLQNKSNSTQVRTLDVPVWPIQANDSREIPAVPSKNLTRSFEVPAKVVEQPENLGNDTESSQGQMNRNHTFPDSHNATTHFHREHTQRQAPLDEFNQQQLTSGSEHFTTLSNSFTRDREQLNDTITPATLESSKLEEPRGIKTVSEGPIIGTLPDDIDLDEPEEVGDVPNQQNNTVLVDGKNTSMPLKTDDGMLGLDNNSTIPINSGNVSEVKTISRIPQVGVNNNTEVRNSTFAEGPPADATVPPNPVEMVPIPQLPLASDPMPQLDVPVNAVSTTNIGPVRSCGSTVQTESPHGLLVPQSTIDYTMPHNIVVPANEPIQQPPVGPQPPIYPPNSVPPEPVHPQDVSITPWPPVSSVPPVSGTVSPGRGADNAALTLKLKVPTVTSH